MKKINVLTGIGLTTLLLATSNQLLAKDVNILCDACSVKEMEVKAKQKLANSLPSEVKEGSYNLNVNVIDFYNDTENTFEVSIDVGNQPIRPKDFKAEKIAPSRKFINDILKLKTAKKAIKAAVESEVIPSGVVSSPWRIPGRSYVTNDIHDHIEQNIKAAIVTTKIQLYTSAMGLIKTPIPHVFKINFDAGGYIEVSVKAAGGAVFGITTKKVIDTDNNTLPSNRSDMKNTFYRVSPNSAYIDDLHQLLNNWNLNSNNLFKGAVKVHDLICDDKSCVCPDCPEM